MKTDAYQPSPWTDWEEAKKTERKSFIEQYNRDEKEPPERFAMTTDEMIAALALESCRYLPGSFEKRFARDMASIAHGKKPQITVRQRAWLWKQVYRYRKQIKDKELIDFAKRMIQP